jgi:uncharacterized protein (DUF1330 family)
MPALPEKPVPCEKPAYLVVISTITDPVKIGVYREALRDSGLYPALGGYYITSGRPVEVLEGSTFKTSPIASGTPRSTRRRSCRCARARAASRSGSSRRTST